MKRERDCPQPPAALPPVRSEPMFGEWIACDDRFPSGSAEVLTWDGDTVEVLLPDTGDIPEHQGPARCKRFGITHWMPFPQPPNR